MKSTTVGHGDLDKHVRAKRKGEAGPKDAVRVASPAPAPIKTSSAKKRPKVSFTVGPPVEDSHPYRGRYFDFTR